MTSTASHPPTQGSKPFPDRERLDSALARARSALLGLQHEKGYWVGELQGDSILESEYILLKWILGQESEPDLRKIANYLRGLQNEQGGWSLFPGGPSDLSGTVKAYFALKLMGDDPAAAHMVRAAAVVKSLGGAEQCNSFTKFYFAALGQISYSACPSIPPEIVFLPKWSYFNLYHVSAWTRTMILPLALVTTLRYRRPIPPELGMAELYIDRAAGNRVSPRKLPALPRNWADLFLRLDQGLKLYDRLGLCPFRSAAIRASQKWLLEHMDDSEGLGAIFPPMVYILIVLRALGFADDHPRVANAQRHLRELFIEEGDKIRIQPCVSPVWDTSLAMHALAESGLDATDPAAGRGTSWLLEKECRVAADWARNCPGVEPSGWFFEFSNPHYPDVDDTAIATMALKRLGGQRAGAAIGRGINWLLAMQNQDGGWAAFDRTRDRPILEKIPFADHNAMQDPSCPDICGRVFESLGQNGPSHNGPGQSGPSHSGLGADHPAVRAGIAFLKKTQDLRGSWWGRWGVNHVYGTWQVLVGLKAVGEDMSEPYVQRAAAWLKSVQKPDGSFGETAQSYEDASLIGQGPSTASQTAWGAMGLLSACGPGDSDVGRALNWLIDHQAPDGNWEEPWYTGTGFPKVFYLKYHLYRLYFPLTALARFARLGR